MYDIPNMKRVHYNPNVQLHGFSSVRLTGWEFGSLSAPYWRWYWNAQPGAFIMLEGHEVALTPDRYVVIPPNTPFSCRLESPVDHLYLHFTASEPYWSVSPELFSFAVDDHVRFLVEQLSQGLIDDPRNDQRLCIHGYTLAYTGLSRIPSNRLKLHKSDPRIDKVLEVMDIKLEKRLTNDDLAAVANLHTNAFIRLFKDVTGYSPQKYMNIKRIERACIMLHNTSVSIEEVAESLGFCDRFHFSRVFKQIHGMGPASFIKTLILAPKDS